MNFYILTNIQIKIDNISSSEVPLMPFSATTTLESPSQLLTLLMLGDFCTLYKLSPTICILLNLWLPSGVCRYRIAV